MSDIVLRPLVRGVKVGAFTCGNESLDNWLHHDALRTGGQGSNRTHLWVDPASRATLGYFTLAPAVVTDNPVLGTVRPAILLAKLAVCRELRGQQPKQGQRLLAEAFRVAVAAADLIGGQYLAVDPQVPELIAYYEAMGFEAVEGEGDVQMLQKMSVIRRALAQV